MSEQEWHCDDCLKRMPLLARRFDLVVADPPYGESGLINEAIEVSRSICDGAAFFFMYAEDLLHLVDEPDQILFWTKTPSTKNTKRRYSRFVEVIAAYDLNDSPFCQNTHWSTRTGTFTDDLIYKEHEFQKPQSLIEKLLAVNSSPGGWVLDPFAGSGTVEKACRAMERNSVSIEIA